MDAPLPNQPNCEPARQATKRRYQPPRLVRFGSLKAMTQSGLGSKMETSNNEGCTRDTHKRPCR